MTNTLSMAGKLSRLRERLRTPEWRKYGKILLMGKFVGIALVFMLALFMHPEMLGMGAHAADDPVLKGNDIVNPLNTVWVLVAAQGFSWQWITENPVWPWYPSARMFRQPAPGDWTSVIAQVKAELGA